MAAESFMEEENKVEKGLIDHDADMTKKVKDEKKTAAKDQLKMIK
jgi:hypothetical protein